MGTHFVAGHELSTEVCCSCGVVFAMPTDMQRRRRNDHNSFFCPAGHSQRYVGETEEDRLKRELAREQDLRINAQHQASSARSSLARVTKAHRKMRQRVMNGVCPCCTRSFSNLREHMKSQHPDFNDDQLLRVLREAFGMSQAAVANEVGVSQADVSQYERGKLAPTWRKRALDEWVSSHQTTETAA